VASAVVNASIAASAAAARRANGECYTPCTPGTACNVKTGACDPLPCRGECRPDETCEPTLSGEACVPNAALELHLGAEPGPTEPLPPTRAVAPPRLPSDAPRPADGPHPESPR
jgi:hypothetical protein